MWKGGKEMKGWGKGEQEHGKGKGGFQGYCNNCNGFGHPAKECPSRRYINEATEEGAEDGGEQLAQAIDEDYIDYYPDDDYDGYY